MKKISIDKINRPFDLPGKWYKGALHLHSIVSDGVKSPTEIIEIYRNSGYDFICFADHEGVYSLESPYPDFITIPSAEIAFTMKNPTKHFHFVGLNVTPNAEYLQDVMINPKGEGGEYVYMPLGKSRIDPMDVCQTLKSMSDLVILAHPYWSNLSSENVKNLMTICDVLEVYNTGTDVAISRGNSEYVWDDALSDGLKVNAVAVDDAHHYTNDCCISFVMVKAEKFDINSLMNAIKNGHYYSSTGPKFIDLKIDENFLIVKTSPCKRVDVCTNTYYGKSYYAENKDENAITNIKFELNDNLQYIRLRCTDYLGKSAWSNPIYL